MIKTETLDVAVIMERRSVDHPWLDHEWVCVGVVPGAPVLDDWSELGRGDGWIRYHAGFRTLSLHHKDTEAYLDNLESERPAVYVVTGENDDPDRSDPVIVVRATVSTYEAQDLMDAGEEAVHAVPVPEQVAAWMWNFLARHHLDQPFVKRRRDKVKIEEHRFGQEPIVELRRRRDYSHEDNSDDR